MYVLSSKVPESMGVAGVLALVANLHLRVYLWYCTQTGWTGDIRRHLSFDSMIWFLVVFETGTNGMGTPDVVCLGRLGRCCRLRSWVGRW